MNDQELKDFQAHFDSCEPEYKIITELLKAREIISELKADGERLFKFVSDTLAHDWKEIIGMTYQGHLELKKIAEQHEELYKKQEVK